MYDCSRPTSLGRVPYLAKHFRLPLVEGWGIWIMFKGRGVYKG